MEFADRLLEGKYRLLRRVGAGGMGEVWEAEDQRLHRRLAVKLLAQELAADPVAVSRFHQEAEAAGRIGHDNICEVIDLGTTEDGVPFLVMPLLRGLPLGELLEQAGRLPPARATDIVAQTLDALTAAHAAGIVHRDLKPDNLFVTRVGDREDFVKILDFGISKVLGDPTLGGRSPTLTRTGSVVGTPAYMAPEQARGVKDIDPRVDVYATGVILYEMLTGRRPFEGDTFNEVLWKIWNDPVTAPRALCPELPVALEAVVLRAMARDREDRYGSAREFRDELQRALAAARRGEDRPPEQQRTVESPPLGLPTTPALPLKPAAPTLTPSAGTLESELPTVPRGRSARVAVVIAAGAAVLAVGGYLLWALAGSRGTSSRGQPDAAAGLVAAAVPAEAQPASSGAEDAADGRPLMPPLPGPDAGGVAVPPRVSTGRTDGEDAATAAVVEAPGAADAGTGKRTETPDLVRIRLLGVPDGATVLVDGAPVGASSFDLARAEREVEVTVRVAGREDWTRRLSRARDAEVAVEWSAPPGRDAGADAAVRRDARTRPDGGGGRPGTRDASTSDRAVRDAGATGDGRVVPDGIVTTFGSVP
ncbi:MAG: serine/threonine protein kinase [Deltaproteobacteria bacterium]|nr:serine/threonine protein kinase [Deltaproteobacteria bacterium]